LMLKSRVKSARGRESGFFASLGVTPPAYKVSAEIRQGPW
jgi:hypothetical protein